MKERTLPRKPVVLSESTQRRLGMYALSATATGVGILAMAQPADAKIIYTPAHAKALFGQPLPVDLNHDGIVDFYLVQEGHSVEDRLSVCQYWQSFTDGIFCSQFSRGTNAIRTIDSKGRKFGAALRYGAKIQRGERFSKGSVLLGGVQQGTGSNTIWYGPWLNRGKGVKHRYLGLKFKINGRLHFGWARITVATNSDMWTATLTGYAYETIPGKGISAGQTQGRDDGSIGEPEATLTAPTREPATLGALAMGAPGLSIWRRKEWLAAGQ
jgi:hypothetical protein